MIIMRFIFAHFITVRYKLVKSEAKQIEYSMHTHTPNTLHTTDAHTHTLLRAQLSAFQTHKIVFIR